MSFMTTTFSMMHPWKLQQCTGPSHWTTSPPSAPVQPPALTTPTLASGSYPILCLNKMALYSPVASWTSAWSQCPRLSGCSSSRTTFTDTTMGTEHHSASTLECHGSTILNVCRPCRNSSTMWQTSQTLTLSHICSCWTGFAAPPL